MNFGRTARILSIIRIASFSLSTVSLLILFWMKLIGLNSFLNALGPVVGAYGSSLSVILSFYLSLKRKARRGQRAGMVSSIAISVSLLWSLFAVGFLVGLLTGALKIEDAKSYLEGVALYVSFIPTGVVSYYFASET